MYCDWCTYPKHLIALILSHGIDLILIFGVLSATFSNISAISWWSVLVVEEAGVPRREPLTIGKQLLNFITCSHRIEIDIQNVSAKMNWLYISDVIRFDNTYSWARGKTIQYLIEVLEPEDGLSVSKSESSQASNSN